MLHGSERPLIEIRELSKTYRTGEVEVRAVNSIHLAIHRGELVAIMGASGSGKSTLMNMLGCLDQPTSGDYLLDGIAVDSLDRRVLAAVRNDRLGFVFQSFNLLRRTTAQENVELPMLYSVPIVSRAARRRRAAAALEKVGLGARGRHFPSQLSGGQQQRVAIARALVNEPELLLADEPTGNLDTRTGLEIMSLFQELNESGLTIVMVTHEPDIAAYCKRTVVMRDGKITSDRQNGQRRDARAERAASSEVEA